MFLRQVAMSIALAASVSSAGVGQPAQYVPPPPAPKFDIDPFRFLLGRWHGVGAFGPSGEPVASTMTFEVASRTTVIVRAAEEAPNDFRYVAFWSKEKGSNELLMLMSSSLDGPALYRSSGWVGDRLTFEPKPGVSTGPSSVRFTYIRRSDRAFELTYEFSAAGTWHVGDKQVFTKIE